MARRTLALFVPLSSLLLLGCPKKDAAESAVDAATTPPATSGSVGVQTAAPCNVVTTTTVDRGARLETGITIRELTNGKLVAIGYATGDGTPKVATVDDTGKTGQADVDWASVKAAKVDPANKRHLFRVTPLGSADGGKMKVGMDYLDSQDKPGTPRSLRCGPADQDAILKDDKAGGFDQPKEDDVAKMPTTGDGSIAYRDCRTFGDYGHPWVVATQVKRAGTGADHDLLYSWVVDDVPGPGAPKDPVIDKRTVKPTGGAYPKVEHFLAPIARTLGDGTVVLAARDQGNLVLARRTGKLEKAGSPESFWLGAAAGQPALTSENGRVFVATTEFQKMDLYASSFAEAGALTKPTKVAMTDAAARTDGDRESASLDAAANGDLFVAFVDGKSPARQARLAVLGADLKQKLGAVFDVTPSGTDVAESHVVALSGQRALVLTLDTSSAVTATIVACKY